MKLPEDRPSAAQEIGSVFSSLLNAFDTSTRRRTVYLAEVKPRDNVLALGFDNELIEALWRSAREGIVAAIDGAKPVERARRTFAEQVYTGRLDIVEANADALPFGANFFQRALCVERFETWPDPAAAFREILRVLEADGILILALRKLDRRIDKKEAAQLNAVAKAQSPAVALLALLREIGFIKCSLVEERYVVATKPLPFR